jgi:hypothetical protein
MKTPVHSKRAFLLLLAGLPGLLAGCLLTHPGASSLAFVEIEGVPVERVREVTKKVFAAEHYAVRSEDADGLVYVRPGTLNDQLQYARYGESLTMRVDVTFEPYGPAAVLVRADAFALHDGSDRDSVRLLKVTRRPYMQLLRRIKQLAEAGEGDAQK